MEFRREFTHAIVRQLPESFVSGPEGLSGTPDLAVARKQHDRYIMALKEAGCEVTILPCDENYPDCVFVEDVAVIVGDHALLTRPGVQSRKGETGRMRELLEAMGLVVMDIKDPEAEIDGGDVIFTGHELLCGQSKRTNRAGLNALAAAFPGFRVVPVEVTGPLHLTTSVGYAYEDTLVVSMESPASQQMFESIQRNSKREYKAIYVEEDMASNCIWINDSLVCKSAKECPKGNASLKDNLPGKTKMVGLDISEIEKAVGSLTCMSLRFRPTGLLKPSMSTTDNRSELANDGVLELMLRRRTSSGYKDVKVVKEIADLHIPKNIIEQHEEVEAV